LYCRRKKRSKESGGKQYTISSTSSGAWRDLRAYGRSLRLTNCRADVSQAINGDLYGRGDRPPVFTLQIFPYRFRAWRRRSSCRPASCRIQQRRGLFFTPGAFLPQVERSNAVVFSPLQILLAAMFYADGCARIVRSVTPGARLALYSDVNLRCQLVPYFFRSPFPARFFIFHDRTSAVGENYYRLPSIASESKRARYGVTPCAEEVRRRQRLLWLHLFTRITVQNRRQHAELQNCGF
jgi:hypothetical protein